MTYWLFDPIYIACRVIALNSSGPCPSGSSASPVDLDLRAVMSLSFFLSVHQRLANTPLPPSGRWKGYVLDQQRGPILLPFFIRNAFSRFCPLVRHRIFVSNGCNSRPNIWRGKLFVVFPRSIVSEERQPCSSNAFIQWRKLLVFPRPVVAEALL